MFPNNKKIMYYVDFICPMLVILLILSLIILWRSVVKLNALNVSCELYDMYPLGIHKGI